MFDRSVGAASLQRWLNALWYGETTPGWLARGVWLTVLVPLSWLFGIAVGLRRTAYRTGLLTTWRLDVPVIVIGNISVGGTGKTPLVIWLARALAARGVRVGVASRGYRARSAAAVLLVTPNTLVSACGDEALLIARSGEFTVAVASNRVAACQELIRQEVRVILCDDGLQHYSLARALEVAVVDGARAFGNAWLLPAGPLREGRMRLREVDVIIYNDGDLNVAVHQNGLRMQLQPGPARNLTSGARRALEDFRGSEAHAVAAIGNPQRFFSMLRRRGLSFTEHEFPDHHDFVAQDLNFGDSLPVLMTAKDAVKCRELADARLWEVPVEVTFADDGAERLLAMVLRHTE